jgi:hypothetical protein
MHGTPLFVGSVFEAKKNDAKESYRDPFMEWLNTRTASLHVIWVSVPRVRGVKISKTLHISENASIPVGLVRHWRMHLCVRMKQTLY